MVEVEGNIVERSIYILIKPRSNYSYSVPKVVEGCFLRKVQHVKSWLVQLATGQKKNVSEVLFECLIELNGLLTKVNLNVFPLGFYDALNGMD